MQVYEHSYDALVTRFLINRYKSLPEDVYRGLLPRSVASLTFGLQVSMQRPDDIDGQQLLVLRDKQIEMLRFA